LYRAVADKFFIPNTVLPFHEALHKVNNAFEMNLNQNLVRAIFGNMPSTGGIQIWCEESGAMRCVQLRDIDTVEPQTAATAATYAMWHTFHLDFEDAKELQQDLFAIAKKYGTKKGGQKYLTHLALTPVVLE
jgi:hypothetical protein